MIAREFVKPGENRPSTICVCDRSPRQAKLSNADFVEPVEVHWFIPPSSTGQRCKSLAQAKRILEAKVTGLLADGWEESLRSLSRRVWLFPDLKKPSKFWAVRLEGATLVVQFGAINGRNGNPFEDDRAAGQIKRKVFPSAADAHAAFDKAIAEKGAEGYKEMWRRRI